MKYAVVPIIVLFLFFSGCSKTENKLPRKKVNKSALTVMRTNDCFSCHSIEDYAGVPSYRMIADRYEASALTISELSEKVINGGGGKWGSAQMVKHPLLKPKDVRSIIQWILSLDSEPALSSLKSRNSQIYADTLHPFRVDIFDDDQKIFAGSMDEVNMIGNKLIQEGRRVVIKRELSITRSGKYFFFLRKSATGKMSKDGNMVISERPEDREIMLELDPGEYPFEIEYVASSESDTLSLFWLPEGKDYYEIMR